MARTIAWRNDRITSKVDPDTDLRVVNLPTIKGMKKEDRDALFAFEREHLGTVRAVIRMNKRASGVDVPVPARLVTAGIPAALKAFYA